VIQMCEKQIPNSKCCVPEHERTNERTNKRTNKRTENHTDRLDPVGPVTNIANEASTVSFDCNRYGVSGNVPNQPWWLVVGSGRIPAVTAAFKSVGRVDNIFGSTIGTAASGASEDRASDIGQLFAFEAMVASGSSAASDKCADIFLQHLHLVLPLVRALAMDVSLLQGVPHTY
jgi:hypothetical protein